MPAIPGIVTVAVVDDHPILRQGLTTVIQHGRKLNVIAEGATADDAVRIATDMRPDIMMIDLMMPGGGLEALSEIVVRSPEVRCIVLTAVESADYAVEAMRRGAKGYVLKGVSADDLRRTIWTVYNNGSYILPSFASKFLSGLLQSDLPKRKDNELSHREIQIIREISLGLSNRQVAIKLGISEKTVKHYMTSAMSKLGVSNRVAAVICYREGHLVAENAGTQRVDSIHDRLLKHPF